MPNLTVSSELDALLAKQTLADAKTYLGVTANETAITAEEARALAAEGQLNTALSAETTRATAAEQANATDIATNATDIATNATDIATNATGIATNATDIATNATDIATNATDISTNATDIATNATDIATETTRATAAEGQLNTALSAEITRAGTAEQANATNIATNATNIATNVTNIATNATDISTNATDITTNINAIAAEETRATAAEALLAPILDATFTGTTTIPSADITTADFNAGDLGGEVSWNNTEKTLDLVTGSSGTTIQLGQETLMYCRNKTGVDILDGQVVKIVGAQGDTPNIELAIASNAEEAHRTIGVATQTILANSGKGFITLVGKVRGLDLRLQDGFTEGGLVYLSATTPGALTPVKPEIEVEIGHALRLGQNNGTLGVFINNEASVYELEQSVPHNTNSVIICNQGDNIQTKYDEAALLSISNKVTLLLMAGTYGDLAISNTAEAAYGVDVIGVGTVTIGNLSSPSFTTPILSSFKNFLCSSFNLDTSYSLIDDIRVNGAFSVGYNLGTIRKVTCSTFYLSSSYGTIDDIKCTQTFKSDTAGNYGTIKNVNAGTVFVENNLGTVDNVNATGEWVHLSNDGTIKNCSANLFLKDLYNAGIIDNCHSNGTDRGFGGYFGSFNSGTVRNCTAKGGESFGQQYATGLTENCIGVDRAFAGSAANLDFNGGLGVQGTYRNCVAGNLSFLGYNNTTNGIKTMEATYINCTAAVNSFGFVNTAGAETHFTGKAINCTGGTNSFLAANNGAAKILNGAVLENCIGGNNSFAGINGVNEGAVLRCRTLKTGASAFKATGTGKVRLSLDGNYNEVNLG